jgi:hypothetical protein
VQLHLLQSRENNKPRHLHQYFSSLSIISICSFRAYPTPHLSRKAHYLADCFSHFLWNSLAPNTQCKPPLYTSCASGTRRYTDAMLHEPHHCSTCTIQHHYS